MLHSDSTAFSRTTVKAAQLIRHRQRHFIVIIIVLVEEGYKLFMRPLPTECP
jgi:hypothetical protein